MNWIAKMRFFQSVEVASRLQIECDEAMKSIRNSQNKEFQLTLESP
jgi:hypothetical protein